MSPAGGPGAFVWFHATPADEAAIATALRRCHAQWVRATPGLSCELLRRTDANGERVTLMEIWRGPAIAGLCERLEREAAAALAPWAVGPRHLELFEPCA